MILTEEEAKLRWCPFSSTGAYTDRGPMGAVSVNRDPRPEIESACRCVGSGCMAWRERLDTADRAAEAGAPEGPGWRKSGPTSGVGGAVTYRQKWVRDMGYCGLAGRP